MPDLTKAERLLIAAARLDARGESEFTTEDLVVEAFKTFPNDFSLKGHPEYPDNNSILTLLMGRDARLIVSGWLEKTGAKKYRLTLKGAQDAAEKAPDIADPTAHTGGALRSERKLEEALARLFQSEAFETFREGNPEEITFHQFCRFVGLAAPDTWQKIQGKLESVRHLVEHARELGESGQTLRIYFRGSTREYSPADLILLKSILDTLTRRFSPEMEEWGRKFRSSS
ncbi:MAG: hypothetical protein ACHQZS_01415 [Candidatus Binatales bacterium]